MRITFVMTGYPWAPMGGFRVVYEYANRLVARGHAVAVVHPRRVGPASSPAPSQSLYRRVRNLGVKGLGLLTRPGVSWHTMDERVRLLFVPELKEDLIPNADAIFATGWQTAEPVVDFPASKGEKFYLIQHYEACIGPKHLVDATWKLPLRKVVVSKWLRDIGRALVGEDVAYIPNAIDHEHYRMIRPIEGRPPQVAMMFSKMPFKGSSDGVDAIRAARERHPRLRAVLFGTSRLKPRLPRWIEYHNNPPQDFIVEEIYNRSSVYLCPSISEGFALPPAEAAACGCAIVATDNGGIRDFIEPGVTGMLSPPRDSRALADGISLLVENEDLRVRLAKACNSFVRRLDWEQNTSTLEGLLQSISPELKGA